MTTDRSTPCVRLAVQAGGGPERLDLGDRLVGFSFEDSDTKTDKASLQLDNFDLSFFDSKLVTKGTLLTVSWGYPGRMAPARELVVRSVRGFSVLEVVAHAKSVLLHQIQRCRAFENMSRAQVARQVAREHGFDDAFIFVESTGDIQDCINQAGETDAAFLARLARREGFRFYVDESGFHWHRRRFDRPPTRVYRYYSDPGQGDVLDIKIENDVLAKPGRVRVLGRDPKQRKPIAVAGADSETQRDTLGEMLEVVDPETGATALERRSAAASVHATAAPSASQAKRDADARYRSSSETAVRLTMRAIGDPTQAAKRIIEMQGISAMLSGKYYVHTVKHTISGAGGYTMELACIKDARGRLGHRTTANTHSSAARPNTMPTKDPDALRPVEVVDAETGRTAIEYRRE